MRPYILISTCFLIILLTSSCKPKSELENEKLQNDLRTYFAMNNGDTTSTIDSFKLLKLDPINQRMLMLEQSSILSEQLKYLVEMYKINTDLLSNSLDQIRLYSMLGSKELLEIQKNNFQKQNAKCTEMKTEVDTVLKIIKTIDSTAIFADTINNIGYQAKCLYQLRLIDKSIKRDTVHIILNNSKDILKREDFLKLPYEIDFNKFN